MLRREVQAGPPARAHHQQVRDLFLYLLRQLASHHHLANSRRLSRRRLSGAPDQPGRPQQDLPNRDRDAPRARPGGRAASLAHAARRLQPRDSRAPGFEEPVHRLGRPGLYGAARQPRRWPCSGRWKTTTSTLLLDTIAPLGALPRGQRRAGHLRHRAFGRGRPVHARRLFRDGVWRPRSGVHVRHPACGGDSQHRRRRAPAQPRLRRLRLAH